MFYLTQARVPELSGFSRGQRHFLIRKATVLMWRDDPWFDLVLGWLMAGCMALAGIAGIYGSFLGAPSAVSATVAFLLLLLTATLHGHVRWSHLRPFLRKAIEIHGKELEEIA